MTVHVARHGCDVGGRVLSPTPAHPSAGPVPSVGTRRRIPHAAHGCSAAPHVFLVPLGRVKSAAARGWGREAQRTLPLSFLTLGLPILEQEAAVG